MWGLILSAAEWLVGLFFKKPDGPSQEAVQAKAAGVAETAAKADAAAAQVSAAEADAEAQGPNDVAGVEAELNKGTF